ncbi:MAG: V-type ATP synthase subunit A [Desulfuromonadales bacterium]|nr:V-type ATP synthase subunit A [Desulfuromonadales bacterium]
MNEVAAIKEGKGCVTSISGATVRVDLPDLKIGDRVFVGDNRLTGEVVRIDGAIATVQVFEENRGLGIGEPVVSAEEPLLAHLGPGLLGSVFDGLQRPLARLRDESGDFISSGLNPFPLDQQREWAFQTQRQAGDTLHLGDSLGHVREGHIEHHFFSPRAGVLSQLRDAPLQLEQPLASFDDEEKVFPRQSWPVRKARPYRRKQAPCAPLVTGQRCLDFLFPLLKGGVAIVPGGFGTGKTILEQTVAKFADVDVVVYVGCGERGNEMAGLLDEFAQLEDPRSGRPLMERTIIVANTSNMPVAARESSIFTAVTMAEYYRDMGLDVLFLADSLSRWAEALREISAALEEMPGEDGYPTYLGSRLSGFIERAGVVETMSGASGSLSMLLAVSPPGADFAEPVTQACLRVAGALYLLDTRLAHRRHFPAINWTQSYSLYGEVAANHFTERHSQWVELQQGCRDILQREGALREIAEVVGMEGLQDADRLLLLTAERIRQQFLCQNSFTADAFAAPEQTLALISSLLAEHQRLAAAVQQGELLDELLKETADAPR